MEPDLDHEYNTRAWAPDYAETLARHAALGAAVRARPDARLDIVWGSDDRQRLDYFPAGRAGAPLALFIHGGYWQYRTSTKQSVAFLAPPFLARGIAFCAVGYALCPEVNMPEMIEQHRAAVAFVRRTLEPARLVVIGHSAGGHLAAMLALTAPGVHAACGISGLYDLRPIRRTYLNAALAMDDAVAERSSPLLNLRAEPVPMVLAYGAREGSEFRRQSRELGARYPAPVYELPDKDHYTATEALLEDGPLQSAVMELFR